MFKRIGYGILIMRAVLVVARTGLLSHMGLVPKSLDALLFSRQRKRKQKHTDAPLNRSVSMGSLARAMERLGPTYVKLGQFLATRSDIIGSDVAAQLAVLQDKMPAFSMDRARYEIRRSLGNDADKIFTQLSPPIAAASIAQVHKARIKLKGEERDVAVKILRPDIEKRFNRDLNSFRFAARLAERFYPQSRRLRPIAAVETLARSVELEMDLRMEGAALSEIAQNSERDTGFRVPNVYWSHTARRVLTTEWIDATALSDVEGVRRAGHDMEALGRRVIQIFLCHALLDGFFHADMHQGNLFVNAAGELIAVDYGIMGRLSKTDRTALADVLYHFLKRDYQRVSDVHFQVGWIPKDQDRRVFAQALRSIGEMLMEKPKAEDLSMGGFLEQLFHITEQFGMVTQPQLLLLQKTMVVVEGVARNLYPQINMWAAAEPILREWMENRIGFRGRVEQSMDAVLKSGGDVVRLFESLPDILEYLNDTLPDRGAHLADKGPMRDMHTVRPPAFSRMMSVMIVCAAWLGALSLAVMAYFLIGGV